MSRPRPLALSAGGDQSQCPDCGHPAGRVYYSNDRVPPDVEVAGLSPVYTLEADPAPWDNCPRCGTWVVLDDGGLVYAAIRGEAFRRSRYNRPRGRR